jgi:hypothetical protein
MYRVRPKTSSDNGHIRRPKNSSVVCLSFSLDESTFYCIHYYFPNLTTLCDVKTIVRIFLPLLYATREEIAYDPTAHRGRFEGELQDVYNSVHLNAEDIPKRIIPLASKIRVYKAIEASGYHDDTLKAVGGGKRSRRRGSILG